jgi:hypothetical protein
MMTGGYPRFFILNNTVFIPDRRGEGAVSKHEGRIRSLYSGLFRVSPIDFGSRESGNDPA